MLINIYARERFQQEKTTRFGQTRQNGISQRIQSTKTRSQAGTQKSDKTNSRLGLIGSSIDFSSIGINAIKVAPVLGLRAFTKARLNPTVTIPEAIIETVTKTGLTAFTGLAPLAIANIIAPEPISTVAGLVLLTVGTGLAAGVDYVLGEQFERKRALKESRFTRQNQAFSRQLRGVSIRGGF